MRTPIDKATLKRYIAAGLTQEQMVAQWREDTGESVTRAAFGMAMKKFGLQPKRTRPRYRKYLPWNVRMEHTDLYPARMLRLLGRREDGGKLTADQNYRLDTWLKGLAEDGAVIHYERGTVEGFWRVPREAGDDPASPIRKPEPPRTDAVA